MLGSDKYQESCRTQLEKEEEETAGHLKQIQIAQQKIIDALISQQRTSSDKSENSAPTMEELRRQLASLDAQLNRESSRAQRDPAMAAQLRARQRQSREILRQAEDLEKQYIEKKKLAENIRKRKEQMVLLTYRAQQEREKMLRRIFVLRMQMGDVKKKHTLQRKLYEEMLTGAQQLDFLDSSDLMKNLDDPTHWESAKEDIVSQLDIAHQIGAELAPPAIPEVPAATAAETLTDVPSDGVSDTTAEPQVAPDAFTLLQGSLQELLRYKKHTDKLSFDELLTKLKAIQDRSQHYLETATKTAESVEDFVLLNSPAQQARITYAGALFSFTAALIPKLESVVSLCAQAKTAVGTDAQAEYAVNYVDILDDVVAEQVGVNPMEAPVTSAKPNAPQVKR